MYYLRHAEFKNRVAEIMPPDIFYFLHQDGILKVFYTFTED